MAVKTALIANYLATRRCATDWRRIENCARGSYLLHCDILMTESPGQATELAREAVTAGYDMLVAVGGDGTINEVLNGILPSGMASKSAVTLGTVPLGSGCDLARSLSIPRDPAEAIKTLEDGETRRVDVGRVDFLNLRNEKESRFFANIADAGAGGLVLRMADRAPRILGQRPNYWWGILTAALSYQARVVNVSIDGSEPQSRALRSFIVANGRYFGRGFLPAPYAKMDDGLFDIVSIGDFNTLESLWHIPKMYNGTLLALEKVNWSRGSKVEANSEEEVLLEMDGELVGRLPATFEIVPGAMRIRVKAT